MQVQCFSVFSYSIAEKVIFVKIWCIKNCCYHCSYKQYTTIHLKMQVTEQNIVYYPDSLISKIPFELPIIELSQCSV